MAFFRFEFSFFVFVSFILLAPLILGAAERLVNEHQKYQKEPGTSQYAVAVPEQSQHSG
jgi:hypothetical protein